LKNKTVYALLGSPHGMRQPTQRGLPCSLTAAT